MSTSPPDWSQPPPPPPPGAGWPGQPPKSKTPLIVGGLIGFALPGALFVFGLILAAQDGAVGMVGAAVALLGLLVPVVAIVLLFPERTRRWGAGMLLGMGIALVVGFVGCVGLISMSGLSYQ